MNTILETFYKDHQVKPFMTTFRRRISMSFFNSWLQINSKGRADTGTVPENYRPSSKEKSLSKRLSGWLPLKLSCH